MLLNVPFHTLVHFRDGPAQTSLRAATLRQKLQIKAFHLTQSQYTDTGPTSPRADPTTGEPLECQCLSHWYDSTPKLPSASRVHTEISRSRGGRLTQGHRCGGRTREKYVLIYSNIETATLCSLPWAQVANFISKRPVFCSYIPATA